MSEKKRWLFEGFSTPAATFLALYRAGLPCQETNLGVGTDEDGNSRLTFRNSRGEVVTAHPGDCIVLSETGFDVEGTDEQH